MSTGVGGVTNEVRLLFAAHLAGSGLELGALHAPYATPLPAIRTTYLDRWTPEEAKRLFPELGDTQFTAADVIADMNTERLSMFGDGSQDYVIASHVLEHVANPLAQLADIHRVLRPGGVAVIFLPDMRRTSDYARQPTTLEHLVEEYEQDVRAVDDAHLEEYSRAVHHFEGEGQELKEYLAAQAERSIHVHCWSEPSFTEVIRYAIEKLGCRFELVDLMQNEEFDRSVEFGYVLRRSTADLPPAELSERLAAQREHLIELRPARGRPRAAEVTELTGRLKEQERQIAALQRKISYYDQAVGPLLRSPVYRVIRPVRRAWRTRRRTP